eukprot:TRINITY_DN28070_c0_g1_i3.p1 TRINITY_DN28070_c0_g1~~TRINITY_DN28070_c0_g1_i3.p1  ORF type:complete len:103 (+),score=18.73 TRINITY_DN28070_c0_g1_i3:86-394(+)
MLRSLVGSEMCIRDRTYIVCHSKTLAIVLRLPTEDPNKLMNSPEFIHERNELMMRRAEHFHCLFYTSVAADGKDIVDFGGGRLFLKKKRNSIHRYIVNYTCS